MEVYLGYHRILPKSTIVAPAYTTIYLYLHIEFTIPFSRLNLCYWCSSPAHSNTHMCSTYSLLEFASAWVFCDRYPYSTLSLPLVYADVAGVYFVLSRGDIANSKL